MNDKERQFKGVYDCVKTIMVKEGPSAFWKGFTMCWIRVRRSCHALNASVDPLDFQLGSHTVLSFVAFERLRLLFNINPL